MTKNVGQFKRKIKGNVLKRLQADALLLEPLATRKVKQAVDDLDVVDTRNLQNNTEAKVFTHSTGVNIRFQTTTVPYAVYPYFGLSTSAKYGQRKWLELGARYFLQAIGIKPK